MKALTTIPNLELLFPLERYLYHAFTNPLKNITYKTFYTLLPFGFRLACLHKIQESILEIKCLYNYYVKEAGLFLQIYNIRTYNKIHQSSAHLNGHRVEHDQ